MTLKQLLVRYNWLNIEAVLLQHYPACKRNVAAYEALYQSLLLLEETDTDLQLFLQIRSGEADLLPTVEVMGRKRVPHISEVHLFLPYGLHFTPWAEWLAMPVSLRSLAQFTETEIIAHCLVDMARNGFDETNIQAQARHLCGMLDELNTTAGPAAAVSGEAILKQLSPRR